MHRSVPLLLLASALLLPLHSANAQGITGAILEGRAVDSKARPVANAQITLRHSASGVEYHSESDQHGWFRIETQGVSGRFDLVANARGHAPPIPQQLSVGSGEILYRIIEFDSDTIQTLKPLTAIASPVAANGGPGFTIPGAGVRALPLLNRDFTGLFAAIPQAVGRSLNSISGQHPGYNAILLDGATASDIYGIGRTPGSLAGAKTISLEALEGLRVMVAPFDVRHGGFSGGLISATTRSGENEFHGTVFSALQRSFLVGSDTAGRPADEFNRLQYGFTASGPIRRNRWHYFVALDRQYSTAPFVGPEAGTPTTGITIATAQRVARIFRDTYGFEAGDAAPPVLTQPNSDVFAKISWHGSSGTRARRAMPGDLGEDIAVGLRAELTHNWTDGNNDSFNRELRTGKNGNGWQLSGSGSHRHASVHATALHIWSSGRKWGNEFLASDEYIAEQLASHLRRPLFLVQSDSLGIYVAGGGVSNAQGTILNQHVFEVSDNISWSNERHEATAGVRLQQLHFVDNVMQNTWGQWTFSSVDALEQQTPSRYEVTLPLGPDGPIADFHARVLAMYVQDRWTPHERIALTGGLRLDAPFLDHPSTNATLDTSVSIGHINTGDLPSGHALISPRIGLRYDLSGAWRTVLRLGAGAFTGETPFVWMGSAFNYTGLTQQVLVCNANDGVPPPTPDPTQRPVACARSAGVTPAAMVVALSPDYRLPQAVKFLAGFDHSFTTGLSASVDFVFTRSRNAALVTDRNLRPRAASAEGRMMYGVINGNSSTPSRLLPRYLQVVYYDNTSQDFARALSVQFRKAWSAAAYVQVGWQWSHTEDVFTVNRPGPIPTLQNAAIGASMTERPRTTSTFDVPHSVAANAVVPLPGKMTLSVLSRVQSGRPFAYVASGDANADGLNGNDLLYVPLSVSDISLSNPAQYSEIDRFITNEKCLSEQRGHIMGRNSCRNPAFYTLDTRVIWRPIVNGRNVELSADIFNLLHLLNSRWGLVREATANEGRDAFLKVTGWDAAANRPTYALTTPVVPVLRPAVDDASRWRVQVGTRVTF